MDKTITVYVQLLEEGTPTIRPTQAIENGNGVCKLLPTPDYDPMDEIWEFLPGTRVKIIPSKTDSGKDILLAIEQVYGSDSIGNQ
ncbi:MAG TPA: hypothetical protein VGF14_06070 [Alphaproteobacteria bacterium]